MFEVVCVPLFGFQGSDAHFLTNIHYLYNESSTTKFNTTLNHTYILKKSLVKKHVYLSGCISMYVDLSADVSLTYIK
jgi:hypothetical protein